MTAKQLRAFKDFIIVRLILLTGACDRPAITKAQIGESLERAIQDIDEWEPDKKVRAVE